MLTLFGCIICYDVVSSLFYVSPTSSQGVSKMVTLTVREDVSDKIHVVECRSELKCLARNDLFTFIIEFRVDY